MMKVTNGVHHNNELDVDEDTFSESGDGFQSSFARALAQASVRRANNEINNHNNVEDNQMVAIQQSEQIYAAESTWQLKEECQRLLEENRRLRASSVMSPVNNEQRAEIALLQTKVNTLSWQLSQSESSRRMLRSVSDQVVTFLDRVSSTMIALEKQKSGPRTGTKVPRSRSTHGDLNSRRDSSPESRSSKQSSRRSTPVCMTPSGTDREFVPRSSLVRSGSEANRESPTPSWCRTSRSALEEESAHPGRLGQQARRLARTVRSLLNTQEPELNTSLTPSSNSPPISEDTLSTSFSQLLRSSRRRLSFDPSSLEKRRANFLQELTEPGYQITEPVSYEQTVTTITIPNNELTPSLSSSDSSSSSSPTRKNKRDSADESGFSSLGSFQEIGLPNTYPQNGLPLIQHSRCRSTPVATKTKHSYYRNSQGTTEVATLEKLKVLWV